MNLLAFKNSKRGLWVGRGLVVLGSVITLCLVYFNGKHGWSLGRTWDEQIALAVMHGAVDPVTALLVSAAAIAIAWHFRWTGFGICAIALLFTGYSMLTTAGFMSNRLASVYGQKAALAELDKQGKWWNSTTYSRDLTRGERLANRAEVRATFKEKVKVASQVHDTQAITVAEWFGISVEMAQRSLNMISSGIGQTMKYMALLVGFFLLSNRDERTSEAEPSSNHKNSGGSDGSGGSGGGEPRKKPDLKPVPKTEPAPMRAEPSKQRSVFYVPATGAPERNLSVTDIAYEIAMQNPHLSTRQLVRKAQKAGRKFSQSTASRAKRELMKSKVDRIVRKYGNGEGYRALAYN